MIHINRVIQITDWPDRDVDAVTRATGDPGWGLAIPALHRVLNSPQSGEPFLAAPRDVQAHAHDINYWYSLLYMLVYSLGWARPDRGLAWWLSEGKPTGSAQTTGLSLSR